MEVMCWSGDWTLPSVDIRCLEVLAYAKFAGCPIKVNRCDNPRKSPIGELPVLQCGRDILASPSKIMDYLREKNFNADYQLTARQGADTLALVSLVHSKLYPAALFTLWVDSVNYTKFTRPWFAKILPFPQNYFVPGRISRQAEHQIRNGLYMEDTTEALEKKLLKDALECLNLLSSHLDGKEFFFGESPTTLDAVVFAHLAVIWKAPLPNSKFRNYLLGHDNLCMFCGRILQRYFPSEAEERQKPKPGPSGQDESDPSERRKTWLAVGFAAVAMTLYALLSGLVTVNMRNVREEDPDEADLSLPSFLQQEDSEEEQ